MRNRERWRPSKYVYRGGRLRASHDLAEVGIGSRLAADLIAHHYGVHLPQHARGRLVDLGCGKAPFYEAYREKVTETICVDWQKSRHVSGHADITCDLAGPLPFPDGTFDTILLSDVVEHVPEPQQLWHEMHRIAARQGKLIMNAPFSYPLHEQPHDFYRYSEQALRRLARQAGFGVLVLRPIGGSPEVLADLLAKHLQFVPLLGKSLALAVQGLAQALIGTRAGRRLSERTAVSLPLGYFLVAEKSG